MNKQLVVLGIMIVMGLVVAGRVKHSSAMSTPATSVITTRAQVLDERLKLLDARAHGYEAEYNYQTTVQPSPPTDSSTP